MENEHNPTRNTFGDVEIYRAEWTETDQRLYDIIDVKECGKIPECELDNIMHSLWPKRTTVGLNPEYVRRVLAIPDIPGKKVNIYEKNGILNVEGIAGISITKTQLDKDRNVVIGKLYVLKSVVNRRLMGDLLAGRKQLGKAETRKAEGCGTRMIYDFEDFLSQLVNQHGLAGAEIQLESVPDAVGFYEKLKYHRDGSRAREGVLVPMIKTITRSNYM